MIPASFWAWGRHEPFAAVFQRWFHNLQRFRSVVLWFDSLFGGGVFTTLVLTLSEMWRD